MANPNGSEEITIYGALWCPDCKRAKKFLNEQRIPFKWIDIEHNPEAQQIVQEHNNGKQIIPTIFFPGGEILVEPTNAELAKTLGLESTAKNTFYDLIVVGSGPAGLTAAIYAAREGIETLVIERSGLGGQAAVTERLDNYPGFSKGITGASFADELAEQARRFGVEILPAQEVVEVGTEDLLPNKIGHSDHGGHRYVKTAAGAIYGATAVLLAPGSAYKRLGVEGEEDFIGAGVHFCATCDGPFYRGKEIYVIGGGNSAAEEGIFLSKFGSKVTLLVRGDKLKASKVIIDKVDSLPNMEVRYHTEVKAFKGKSRLESITVYDNQTGESREEQPGAVFVFVGLNPNTEFLGNSSGIKLDERGFIVTDRTLETSLRGVFAAGDARAGSTKQVASAVGEGATAALMVREHLKEHDEQADYANVVEADTSCM
jgi:thioredoxin reductase (NADPH)